MFNIIIFTISLALMAALMTASIVNLPAETILRHRMLQDGLTGAQVLSQTASRFFLAKPEVPLPATNSEMATLLFPTYGFLPAAPTGLAWSVYSGSFSSGGPADSIAACLHAQPGSTISNIGKDSLQLLKTKLPVGSVVIATTCNATADTFDGEYLTYWLPKAHFN